MDKIMFSESHLGMTDARWLKASITLEASITVKDKDWGKGSPLRHQNDVKKRLIEQVWDWLEENDD